MKKAYLQATPAQQEIVLFHLSRLLSLLRAQYLNYQTSHWQACGDPAYADHLLFERLYGSVLEEIDSLAEKMVGYLFKDSVSLESQSSKIFSFCQRWSKVSNPFQRALLSEEEFQGCLQEAYDKIKACGSMPLGLDDWLMSTANAHETNTYLLQQRSTGLSFEKQSFFGNPEKKEVSQFSKSKALTNVPAVSKKSPLEQARLKKSPPTPSEIEQEPGGDEISTLNRYVVDSEEPGVPTSPYTMEEWLSEL